jgi:NIPSNAP
MRLKILAFGIAALAMITSSPARAADRVFELRTYTTHEGRLDALKARFRDHTVAIFNRHGMTSIGYWVPTDAAKSQNTLIYILSHPSMEEAKKHWDEFRNDPEWKKVSADSERDGKIVSKVESVYMTPADFSMLK